MRRLATAAVGLLLAASGPAFADDPLARARALYNQKQFEEAVTAAEQARIAPARADAADLVAARAYLERFRASGTSDDLTNARDRLRRIDPQRFPPRERMEYVVGLGEALFFDNAYGAAATVFDSVLQSRDASSADARERVLDWWATALDREAKPRPEMDRQSVYVRIRARMEDELALRPTSGTAAYWLAAAARAQGDHQSAWDSAQAGWVRSALAGGERGAALREDLDRLVLRGIVPDRARATAQSPDALRAQWELFKERWRR
jgi:tetratricopeptide (TPR) repeat protein